MRKIVIFLAITILIAGCAIVENSLEKGMDSVAYSPQRYSQKEVGNGITKNQNLWSMPTDAYFNSEWVNIKSAAEALLRTQCMQKAGHDYSENATLDIVLPETESLGFGRIFNERIAKKYGYRNAPDLNVESNYPINFDAQSKSYQDDYNRCVSQAMDEIYGADYGDKMRTLYGEQEEIPGENATETEWQLYMDRLKQKNEQSPMSLLNRLHVDTHSPALREKAKLWVQCMSPLGIVDLPEEPFEIKRETMPESLQMRWNWESSGVASADEIAVATYDAQCRRSSGWFDALYEEEWHMREEFLMQYEPALAPVLEMEKEATERARKILTEKGSR